MHEPWGSHPNDENASVINYEHSHPLRGSLGCLFGASLGTSVDANCAISFFFIDIIYRGSPLKNEGVRGVHPLGSLPPGKEGVTVLTADKRKRMPQITGF